ncbi:Bug family tripartite tricarboxylate transporter substrate binding protein [Muricoccus radiodurans]|uniref:Bug family tripartite tricarboxylate transporter substrate binding protein n=1 Tax=Muricoccus radiodurans TaxID=2231721 RepID=UPI003CF039E3
MRRRTALVLALALGGHARAQDAPSRAPSLDAPWTPTRPVRFVVPYPAGGITDLLARKVGEELGALWGQPVVADNRPGAGGNIAAQLVARAPADGHTIFMGFLGTQAANAALYPELGYDPVRDFTPIGLIAQSPMVLTVHPGVPARSVAELIAHARANPGALTFGSSGNGGASHLALELFKSMAGVEITHVPYRGTAPLMTDLLAGRISGYFDVAITAAPNIAAGSVRALGVSLDRRAARLPDVPTIAEGGLPGYVFSTWLGLLTPAGLPAPILSRMSRDLQAVVRSPGFAAWCAERGLETMPSTPEAFVAFIDAETAKFGRLIREANVRLD